MAERHAYIEELNTNFASKFRGFEDLVRAGGNATLITWMEDWKARLASIVRDTIERHVVAEVQPHITELEEDDNDTYKAFMEGAERLIRRTFAFYGTQVDELAKDYLAITGHKA